jgi:hypothetical protein
MKTVSFSYPSTRNSLYASAFTLPGADANAIVLFDGEEGPIWRLHPAVDSIHAIIGVNYSSSAPAVSSVYNTFVLSVPRNERIRCLVEQDPKKIAL